MGELNQEEFKEMVNSGYVVFESDLKKRELKTYRIFKPLKKLDIEIRTIKEELDEKENKIYYVVEVGYYESLGELGLINSFFYDEYPKEEEILKDTEEDLRNDFKKLKENFCLSSREEQYLKILRRVLK